MTEKKCEQLATTSVSITLLYGIFVTKDNTTYD
jgi:hypothetical protein